MQPQQTNATYNYALAFQILNETGNLSISHQVGKPSLFYDPFSKCTRLMDDKLIGIVQALALGSDFTVEHMPSGSDMISESGDSTESHLYTKPERTFSLTPDERAKAIKAICQRIDHIASYIK